MLISCEQNIEILGTSAGPWKECGRYSPVLPTKCNGGMQITPINSILNYTKPFLRSAQTLGCQVQRFQFQNSFHISYGFDCTSFGYPVVAYGFPIAA